MGSYSFTRQGEIRTDGTHVDIHGNPVPNGLDEDTKAELQRQIDGPVVRTLPSEADMIRLAEVAGASSDAVVTAKSKTKG